MEQMPVCNWEEADFEWMTDQQTLDLRDMLARTITLITWQRDGADMLWGLYYRGGDQERALYWEGQYKQQCRLLMEAEKDMECCEAVCRCRLID